MAGNAQATTRAPMAPHPPTDAHHREQAIHDDRLCCSRTEARVGRRFRAWLEGE